MKRARRSAVWDHYSRKEDKVHCSYSDAVFTYHSTTSQGFKYIFAAIKCKNQFITVIKCSFLDVFVDILSLTVKIDLPLQL